MVESGGLNLLCVFNATESHYLHCYSINSVRCDSKLEIVLILCFRFADGFAVRGQNLEFSWKKILDVYSGSGKIAFVKRNSLRIFVLFFFAL